MRKGMVFHKTVGLGVISCLLGLGACAISSDETEFDDDIAFVEETVPQNAFNPSPAVPENDSIACAPGVDECENSDDYLVNRFSQADRLDIKANDDSISLSRPAGHGTVSVKEKQIAKHFKDGSTYGSITDTASKEPTDKVLYTTIAIPEEIGTTKTTETTLDTTKITKSPAENVVLATPEGLIPLKKTTTTITETTQKMMPEKKDTASLDFKKMTLAERVEYGQSEQDWDAKSGDTLRGLLVDWGNRAGWTVIWKLDRDYHLEAGVTFRGTFTEVAGALIRSFARATPAPIGTFHQGNRVLVINTQENENEH